MNSNDIRQIPRATLQELGTMREVSGELNPEFIDATMTSCTHLLLAEIAAQLAEGSIPLRDRFAMAALTGLLADHNVITNGAAMLAYDVADDMLKAREVK